MRNRIVADSQSFSSLGDMRKPSIPIRWVMTMAVAMAVLFTAVAQARLVQVYYPEGHYLGCGTPAADGSGIWSYDASISEADCHDIATHQPDSSLYVSAYRGGDFNDLATKVLSSFTQSVRGPDGSFVTPAFDATHVESGTQTGVGAALRLNDWLTLDLGLSVGSGTASRTSNLRNQGEELLVSEKADFRLFGGSIAAKFYPLQTAAPVQPWLSAGVRGLALRPTGGTYITGDQRLDLPSRSFQPTSTADLTSGAGVDIHVTDQLGVTFSGDHGFNTGWRAGAAVTFALYARRPWTKWPLPPRCGPGERPPCGEWPPPFPFLYLGSVHSEGLDAVLHSIQQATIVPPERQRTMKDLEELVKESGHRFLQSRNLKTPGFDAFQAGWELARAGNVNLATISGFERLKVGQKRYLLEVQRLVVEAPEKPAGRPFEDLGRKALKELGVTDAQVVLISASVADGSLDYWRGHAPAWEDAVGGYLGGDSKPQGLSKFWKTILRVVEVDFGSAAAGAFVAAVKGEDVIGGAIGGAIEGSVGAVVNTLF